VFEKNADLTSNAELKSECSLSLHKANLILSPVFNIIFFQMQHCGSVNCHFVAHKELHIR